MASFLDFEKPIAELQARIDELRDTAADGELDIATEIGRLQTKSDRLLRETYAKLTPWQKTQVARHPERPHFKHYVASLVEDFMPLGGDRAFADDRAILGGIGRFRGRKVMVIGHEKGDDTATRLRHNFGMGKPEGYRKAIRLMQLADRFGLPVVTLVDTSGAFPGIQAEERGQAEAIARSTEAALNLGVPMVSANSGRGRIGRRDRAGGGQPGADDGARGLFGDLARGLRVDPVAYRRQGAGSGGSDAGDGAGPEGAGRDRPDRRRTAGRGASRSGGGDCGAG